MGTIAELQSKPDRDYPLLWLSNEGGSLDQNYKVDNIRLTMFGRVIAGEEGQDDDASEIEVLSDMQLILLDFLNYFHQQHGQEYVTDKAAQLEHFTERTNDRTAGYSCVLELKQFYDWNKCQIPESGASIPPTVDGLTLYDFCDASTISRLTSQQVTCLEAEFGTICADATVENSNTTYSATVASGGTLVLPNINFTDSDGTTSSVPSVQDIVATPCTGGATLTIGVFSDAGATIPITSSDFGTTIYIKATASATQSDYTLFIDNGVNSILPVVAIDASASHIFEYTIALSGTLTIYVIATDATNGIADNEPFTFTVTGINPPEVSGNVLWVDAELESTYALNGTFVQQLKDLSGLSNDLTSPTVGNQPLYLDVPDGINGLRSTQYSSGKYLRKLGLSLDIISGHSIFIVVNFYASANGALISTDDTYNGSGGYLALEQNGFNIRVFAPVAGYTPNYPISLDTNYLIEIHRTPTQERFILNGVTLITRAIGTGYNRTNFWVNTGYFGYPSAKWGDIAVFNTVISPTNETDLRSQLMTKWNIV